jgi:hypothetical protein
MQAAIQRVDALREAADIIEDALKVGAAMRVSANA